MYTKENIIDYVKEEDVKFIRLVFCDISGIQKNISIMPNELESVLDKGLKVSTSLIHGYEHLKEVVLVPDKDTLSVLPWRPTAGRVVRMFCDLYKTDGTIVAEAARDVLKHSIINNKVDDVLIRTDFEFYLFKMDEEGNNTYIPYDKAGYMDIAPDDKGENLRREVRLSLADMEIETCGSYHAEGPGQNMIALNATHPLAAAENAITFEAVVKTIAARNGLYADFSHIPLKDKPVSKHRIVIKADKANIKQYYENLKKHYDEIYLFLNNTEYLYADYDKGSNVTYDEYNEEIYVSRVSFTSNSYLTYALLLDAICDDELTNTKEAKTLTDAKAIAKKSSFIKKHVPVEILKQYLD